MTALKLALSEIRVDGGTQPRSVLDNDTILEYAVSMADGIVFPPVTVYYDGDFYWLADGFHRVRAAVEAEQESIEAQIIQGTVEDAKWHSFGANQCHGLRRTNEDKQRAVQAALKHPKSQALSNYEIAQHVGVDEITVRRWRKADVSTTLSQIETATESLPVPPATRTVTRKGKTYEQNVTNIGKRNERRQPGGEPERTEKPTVAIPAVSRKSVWACQQEKNFKRELLRLVRAYEKANPPIVALTIERRNGVAVDVQIVSKEGEAWAS